MNKEDIIRITFIKGGHMYVIYSIKDVKNNINTKSKNRNEVLIVGIPAKHVFRWLYKHDFTMDDLIDKMKPEEQEYI